MFYAIMGSGHCGHAGSVPDRVKALSKNNPRVTVITVKVKGIGEYDRDLLSVVAENKYIIAGFLLII